MKCEARIRSQFREISDPFLIGSEYQEFCQVLKSDSYIYKKINFVSLQIPEQGGNKEVQLFANVLQDCTFSKLFAIITHPFHVHLQKQM